MCYTKNVSKYLNEAIVVRCREGKPVWLRRNGRWLRVVDVADCWREVGYWWEGETEKEFLEIVASLPGQGEQWPVASGAKTVAGGQWLVASEEGKRAYVIYRDLVSGQWFLYKVFD